MKLIYNTAHGGGRLQKMDTYSKAVQRKRATCQSCFEKMKHVTKERENKCGIMGVTGARWRAWR